MVRTTDVHRIGSRLRTRGRGWRFAALLLCTLFHAACATAHDPNGPPLQLHRGAWGPQFTHNGPAKQSVFNWASLDTAFVAVLAPDAAALEEARRATPLRTAALVSYVGMTVFTTKMLITAFDATADGVTQGDVDSVNSDYIFVVGFGLGATVFEQLGLRHLRRAVSMYNVGATSSVGMRGMSDVLRQSLFNLSVAPTFEPGRGFGLVTRTGFNVH